MHKYMKHKKEKGRILKIIRLMETEKEKKPRKG